MPAPTLLHVPPYGAVVSLPINVDPLKNSTFATVPTVVDASAASVSVMGAR